MSLLASLGYVQQIHDELINYINIKIDELYSYVDNEVTILQSLISNALLTWSLYPAVSSLSMASWPIVDLPTPINGNDAANKNYVDSVVQPNWSTQPAIQNVNCANYQLTNLPAAVDHFDATNKDYVDNRAPPNYATNLIATGYTPITYSQILNYYVQWNVGQLNIGQVAFYTLPLGGEITNKISQALLIRNVQTSVTLQIQSSNYYNVFANVNYASINIANETITISVINVGPVVMPSGIAFTAHFTFAL